MRIILYYEAAAKSMIFTGGTMLYPSARLLPALRKYFRPRLLSAGHEDPVRRLAARRRDAKGRSSLI